MLNENFPQDDVEVSAHEVFTAVFETGDKSLAEGLGRKMKQELGVRQAFESGCDAMSNILAHSIHDLDAEDAANALESFALGITKEICSSFPQDVLNDADKCIKKAVDGIQNSASVQRSAQYISGLINTVTFAAWAKKQKLGRGEEGIPSPEEIQAVKAQMMQEDKIR